MISFYTIRSAFNYEKALHMVTLHWEPKFALNPVDATYVTTNGLQLKSWRAISNVVDI